jgi:hypothetical protein
MPAEFICARCGIKVILIVEDKHPENIYCLTCRFIEGMDSEEDKEAVQAFLDRNKEDTGP